MMGITGGYMISYGRHTNRPSTPIDCYEGVEVTFGNFCSIASGLTIISGQHPIVEHKEAVSQYPFKEEFGWNYPPCKMDGKVTIGSDVWIGQNVTILEGVTIGDGVIIGACSVVAKDVPCYTVVAGNTARIKKYRFTEDAILALMDIQWWNWSDDQIKEAIPYMNNVDEFISKFGYC